MNRMFVFIGRFQPFHNGHLALLENAINDLGIGASADESSHDAFTILIGSSEQKDTIQNPLSSDERMNCINSAISLIRAKYDIPTNYSCINDSCYNYNSWIYNVQSVVNERVEEEFGKQPAQVILIGFDKVKEYAFATGFDFYQSKELKGGIHGSDIRKSIIEKGIASISDKVPKETFKYLKKVHFEERLLGIYKKIEDYDKSTGAKYATCFLTVDNLVIEAGHVLLVKRKDNGKFAMPGGFQEPTETAKDAAKRELEEETGLRISSDFFALTQGPVLFDSPFRGPRAGSHANMPTHVFLWKRNGEHTQLSIGSSEDTSKYKIKSPSQTVVKGGDDAAESLWMPFNEIVNRPQTDFHGDHKKIICNMLKLPYTK